LLCRGSNVKSATACARDLLPSLLGLSLGHGTEKFEGVGLYNSMEFIGQQAARG